MFGTHFVITISVLWLVAFSVCHGLEYSRFRRLKHWSYATLFLSIFHAVTLVTASVFVISNKEYSGDIQAQRLVLFYSFCFFVLDTFAYFLMSSKNMNVLVHHILALGIVGYFLFIQEPSRHILLMCALAEASVTFYVLEMLKLLKKQQTTLFRNVERLHTAIFVPVRLFVIPWIILSLCLDESMSYSLPIKVIGILFAALGIWWAILHLKSLGESEVENGDGENRDGVQKFGDLSQDENKSVGNECECRTRGGVEDFRSLS